MFTRLISRQRHTRAKKSGPAYYTRDGERSGSGRTMTTVAGKQNKILFASKGPQMYQSTAYYTSCLLYIRAFSQSLNDVEITRLALFGQKTRLALTAHMLRHRQRCRNRYILECVNMRKATNRTSILAYHCTCQCVNAVCLGHQYRHITVRVNASILSLC